MSNILNIEAEVAIKREMDETSEEKLECIVEEGVVWAGTEFFHHIAGNAKYKNHDSYICSG